MTATLTRPLPFTVMAADQIASAPARNAADDRPGKVWRASAAASYVVLDLATASYDRVALVGTNMIDTDLVRVRTGTTTTGIGSSDQTVSAIIGPKPLGFTGKSIINLGATRTERYMRIDIIAATPAEVQRIVVGPSISTIGIDYDAEQAPLDTSTITTDLGDDVIQAGRKKIRWKFSMSMVPTNLWRSDWLGFLNAVGRTIPVLFVPFIDQPETYQSDAVFGRIRNDVSGKIPGLQYRAVEMTIEGISI